MSLSLNNLVSALVTNISSYTASSQANSTTSSISAVTGNSNGGTLTYAWQQSGTACTIVSGSSSATTFTGSSTVGTTTVYCNVTNSATGTTTSTPLCVISWTTIPITAATWLLNGSAFSGGTVTLPGSWTFSIATITPSGATYSLSQTTFNTAGSWTCTASGTGNYAGSATSPTLTINSAPSITGSITEIGTRPSGTQCTVQATLTGATATGYAWSRIGGTNNCSFSNASVRSPTVTSPGAGITSTSQIQCIISYSGGTVTPTYTIAWGIA
jgi:hypothetical protein